MEQSMNENSAFVKKQISLRFWKEENGSRSIYDGSRGSPISQDEAFAIYPKVDRKEIPSVKAGRSHCSEGPQMTRLDAWSGWG